MANVLLPNSTDSMEMNRMRSTIHYLLHEKQQLESKLIGVQVLADQLDRKEEECRILKSKLEQFEVLLSRAENRIAQLTQLPNGKGSLNKGVVTPGVSKKLLESLTRENTKLKLALEHVLNKNPKGIDLAVENHDLHDMVIAQKDELQQVRKESEELRSALKAIESDDTVYLREQVSRLTAELTNTERSLKAKQIFCETVVSENERIKSSMEAVKSERITQLAILKKLANDYPVIKEIIERTWCGPEDSVDGENKAELEKVSKKIEELQKKLEESENINASLHNETDKLKEANAMLAEEMHQLDAQSKTMLDGFIEENDKLKNEMREMGASFEEANMLNDLMKEQCKTYENDFKAERKEKEKATAEVKTLLKQLQETMQEKNHLKSEMDKVMKIFKTKIDGMQANQPQPAPRQKAVSQQYTKHHQHLPDKSPSPPSYTQEPWKTNQTQEPWKTNQATGGYKSPHFNPMQQGIVCSDGPQDKHVNPGHIQCPICQHSLPYDQIEDHINDCDHT